MASILFLFRLFVSQGLSAITNSGCSWIYKYCKNSKYNRNKLDGIA